MLKDVTHREKGRNAQDRAPYRRGSWDTKGHTPSALFGIIFKS